MSTTDERQVGHLFTADMQPATDYVDRTGDEPMRFQNSPRALLWCYACGRRRRAENMDVQVFYDSIRFWCKDKKGCRP